MALINWLKVLRALQRSEEIKRNLDYCINLRRKDVCSCRHGELCQRALAIATDLSDNAIKNMLYRLERHKDELGDWFPFEIRVIEAGMNQPRKFIRLRSD